MATARRTLVCFSWALGRRRSAKTLPELLVMGILPSFLGLAFFGMACLIFDAGCVQPLRDYPDIFSRCANAAGRFLLENMEYIDGPRELDRIDGTIGAATIVFDDLQNARPFTLPGLSGGMLAAELRHA